MLELIDIENREKGLQSVIMLQVDSATTYKGFIHPNIVKFNEEIFGEILISEEEQALWDAHANRSDTLLGDIIKRLEKTNLQQEKIVLLRKLQKQKEKKQILSERIEQEVDGPESTN